MNYSNLFGHCINRHLLLNIDKRLKTNTKLFIDQFNSKETLNTDMKIANSESFPNYEVKKDFSNEFQLFDATYKVLLVKFH